ncbi:MAG: M55 family metallopeptidase [Armatimonadetes bacterium]|nr:M55 family metallopeptidase [Armatimonadota bacterium]
MKLYISADIEGTTGTVSWGQAGRPDSNHYDWPFARRMMTHDVNAAIRGARRSGATEIVIKDSHGTSKNLLIDQLEDGVELISGMGSGRRGMMEGIDESFDGCFLVGYHGMAGTIAGVMEHTISGRIHRCWINGEQAGEIAISTATAGHLGVPLLMVSSDEAGCAEAQRLVPAIETAVVKQGLGRYMAKLKHPSVTGPMIEAAAEKAVRDMQSQAYTVREPVVVRIEFNRSEEVDAAALLDGWIRVDAYTQEYTADDWATAHNALRRAMSMASLGAEAN